MAWKKTYFIEYSVHWGLWVSVCCVVFPHGWVVGGTYFVQGCDFSTYSKKIYSIPIKIWWPRQHFIVGKAKEVLHTCAQCYNKMLLGNLRFRKILKLKKNLLMPESAQKCLFSKKYVIRLFNAFKMASSCRFSEGGNLDLQDCHTKMF